LIERYRPLIEAGINHLTLSRWVSDPWTLRLIAEKVVPEPQQYYAARRRVDIMTGV
jgi:hypothetical protein